MSEDVHPWPPKVAGELSRLYNAEFSRVACNLGFDSDEAHEQACKRIQQTGRPPPLIVSTASHDYHTGLSRTEICEALAMETIRRAVYEGAIRRIFEVVGDVGTEDDPARAALTKVYNLCNTAIPGLNGAIPEPEEDDGIAADQEKLRRMAHDSPHDELAGDLLYFSHRNKDLAVQADKRCKEAQISREQAFRERDTALRDASRLRRELESARTRISELESDLSSR